MPLREQSLDKTIGQYANCWDSPDVDIFSLDFLPQPMTMHVDVSKFDDKLKWKID